MKGRLAVALSRESSRRSPVTKYASVPHPQYRNVGFLTVRFFKVSQEHGSSYPIGRWLGTEFSRERMGDVRFSIRWSGGQG